MPDDPKPTPEPATPRRLREEAVDQLRADYLKLETNAKYVFRDREATPQERAAADELSRVGQQHPTPPELAAEQMVLDYVNPKLGEKRLYDVEARYIVAAVRSKLADEVALQLGRESLRDGLAVFLDRLVGPQSAAQLLAPIRAQALHEAADRIDGGRMGRVKVSYGYIAGWLRRHADESTQAAERGDTDAR